MRPKYKEQELLSYSELMQINRNLKRENAMLLKRITVLEAEVNDLTEANKELVSQAQP